MNESDETIAQVAGTLSALSIVVLEICKTLPPEARAGVQQQLEKLRATAADGEGGFAVSVTEICDQFLSEI